MNPVKTLEQLWARQQISCWDVDYDRWEQKRGLLQQMADISRHCVFTVDVYKGVYDFASAGFADMLGYERRLLSNIEKEGDFLEERIHPEDWAALLDLQIRHSRFIYSLPAEERNDYSTAYQYRIRNSRDKYVNVVSRQQVFEKDRSGKAWMIMGMLDLAPDQNPCSPVKCSVLNLRTGGLFDPLAAAGPVLLTRRELEILNLIGQGYLSKEIAARLGTSIYTIHNHRKNILSKLNAGNAMEAVNAARHAGWLE